MMCAAHGSGEIFFFGGVGAGLTESILDVSNDMWSYSTRDFRWTQISEIGPWPAPRRCAGFLADGDSLALWGGSGIEVTREGRLSHNFLNDLWIFDLSARRWSCVEEENPDMSLRPGKRYTPVMHQTSGGLFLFGGYTEDAIGKRKLNDAWIRRGSTWQEITVTDPAGYRDGAVWPGVRYGSQSATDGENVYIFGGFSDEGDHNDLWVYRDGDFDLVRGDSTSTTVPLPRYCAAFDFHDGGLYLFGGRSRRDPKANYSDLWRFDLADRTWTELHGHGTTDSLGRVTPGYHAKSSVAVVDNTWYLWGGEGPRGHVSDFWSYSFGDCRWSLISPSRDDDPVFW
jgi:N-acetylneuraminic acid mutarotase